MLSSFKKIITIVLALTVALFTTSVAHAAPDRASATKQIAKVIEKTANGNQVVEITKGDKKTYAVVSAPIAFKDLPKTEQLRSQSAKRADGANITRTYLQFADTLTEAQQVAATKPNSNTTTAVATTESTSYFWHNSYIENWWNLLNGYGYHIYLSPVDTSYVTNVGWVVADTLAAVLVATAVVTAPVGLVIGGIVTVAVLTTSWLLQNNDGSIDIYSPDKERYDSYSVDPGQYLGSAKNYDDIWKNYYWPSYAPAYAW